MVCIKRKICILVLIVLIYISKAVYTIYEYSNKYVSDAETKEYMLSVIEKQKETEDKVVYLAKFNNDKFLVNIYFKNKYTEKDNFSEEEKQKIISLTYGDYIKVNGKIVIAEMLGNIGEFNYKRYLNSKGIYGTINGYSVEYVENRGDKIGKIIYKIRDKISAVYNENLEEENANLLKGMIYGDTKELNEEIKEWFQNIGISHITAVSGSNLNNLLVILGIVAYKFSKKRIYMIFQIICIIMFCCISGLELSVLRASIMTVILIICKARNVQINIYKTLVITFFIMLGINPLYIFNVGMTLSFLSIIGIAVFSKRIYNFFESKIKWRVKNKKMADLLCKIFNLVSITLGIYVVILPITIYYFNSFSLITILSNLMISFLSDIICMLGMISLIFFKLPYVSKCMFYVLNVLLKFLIYISKNLNKIAGIISIKELPIYLIVIYYMYVAILCFSYSKTCHAKITQNAVNKIKNIILSFFIVLCAFEYIKSMFCDNYIYFFNVGQGEMALVKEKDTYIMVDSGSITNDTSYIFDSFAKRRNIDKIDALVISHFHEDHINGVKDIIEKYNVEYLIYSYPYDMENEEYVKITEKLKESATKSITVKAGDNIIINNISLDVLFPQNNYLKCGDSSESENANSLVVNMKIKEKNYLFTGDSTKASEKYVLESIARLNISKIDLIKVAHHGSKTSSSEEYISKICPKVAIISAKYKVYKHPSEETLKVLNKYGVITYVTEKVGGIKYVI